MVRINSFKFGEVTVEGKTYYSDVVVFWDGKVMLRRKEHIFGMGEFLKILERKPTNIVIGTGVADMVRVAPEVVEVAKRKKVKLFVDKPENAVDIFNGLAKSRKKVVAVIHTTA